MLVIFLALSRAGVWTYDLTTKELTQTLVPKPQLSSFAGVQQTFISTFELMHWVLTAALGRPGQFRWLALGSLGAVGTACASYALWVLCGESRRKRVQDEKSGEERVELLREEEIDDR